MTTKSESANSFSLQRTHDLPDRLAEISHNLLEISLSLSVPASLRNIPTKYNIIVRLWTYGFHKLLESLRHASFNSPLPTRPRASARLYLLRIFVLHWI